MFDFLLQKDTPIVITILVAAWTWILSEQIKTFENLQVIQFRMVSAKDVDAITFTNISHAKNINGLKIEVACDKKRDCLDDRGGFYGTIQLVPPLGVSPTLMGAGTGQSAYFNFDLPIGAKLNVLAYKKDDSRILFSVINSKDFDSLTIVNASSFFSKYYTHIFTIIYSGLAILSGAVLILLSRAKSPGDKRGNEPIRNIVELRLRGQEWRKSKI
ncbi:hypothetical protein SAMN05444161_0455 [Rhizobiales bacterium GAS191]|nr:hypothetical protein SAMN05444161_0455 [Rhizobiales bacterium GAS191]